MPHAVTVGIRFSPIALAVLTLSFLCSVSVWPQTTARISGTVVDETGAVIPGASVEVTNVAMWKQGCGRTPQRTVRDTALRSYSSLLDQKGRNYTAFIGVWSVNDNGDVPPRWVIGGPNGMLRQARGVALDPKRKAVIVSDKQLNAVLTYCFPEIF